MRLFAFALGALAIAGAAVAQQQPSQQTAPIKPSVTTPDSTNPMAPVKGKNSFTESQARDRIEQKGFADITNLKLGEDGVWRASAQKNGVPISVALDYQGNITEGAL
ncbi:PepSY domain-containing protein [Mesorhizobium retamae]|uniref:PepSY domain-containing protein n=1 Tax=Mesorhizobium retamae TaxID=2912854 RepID=A0ABS9QEU8_9HYPH|nr:PepSY domain-containing protein [Mesorhizobium sp. IRAMC:0171]MCG7505946.1 PepSY domain-containing protein [Mesorhizobium sp. IRAMC:0171]